MQQSSLPNVIYLHGAIQVPYFNQSYNIPVNIYVPPNYPSAPPFCYIKPTESIYEFISPFFLFFFLILLDLDMMIKPRHKLCDTEGVIYHPMISRWSTSYSIAQLITQLLRDFANDIPVSDNIDWYS